MADRERPPFQLQKIGHVVLNVSDLEASIRFYTEVLGLKVSDRYGDDLVPGGMVFMRCATDHHGLALVGGAPPAARNELNHFAWEVATLEEVFQAREFLRAREVPIHFEGRRRAGCQIAVEFKDPDGNSLEIYWGIDQIGSNQHARPESEWRQALTLEDAISNPVPGQQFSPTIRAVSRT
jgi:catechol 2,3-dioxygenase-like lactoylglutathione lyase family enzyme